jgi:rhamnosyl/mannosyltransferase
MVPYGIDFRRLTSRDDASNDANVSYGVDGSLLVLFVGRFRYYKGLHILIKSMEKVNGKLLLIGAGPLERTLRKQVTEAALEDKVLFLGDLSDAERDRYFRVSDVLVLPSHLRSEAFGIVQLEAMANGKPVVCTELGTGTSFVNQHGKTGLVLSPNDVNGLAHGLNHLLKHAKIRERYGKAGLERVQKHFTKDRMTDRIMEIYESVLAGQSLTVEDEGKYYKT